MSKISFVELKEKYPTQDVAPFGSCVVVPGSEFDPDWEVSLADLGYRCSIISMDGKAVTLVRPAKLPPGKTAYVPPAPASVEVAAPVAGFKSASKAHNGKEWTKAEEDLLVVFWGKFTANKDIVREFRVMYRDRTESSIHNRIQILQSQGKIKPRFVMKAKAKAKPTKKVHAPAEPEPKWNGEFGEKCNRPIDCDITECTGRESEREIYKPTVLGVALATELIAEKFEQLEKTVTDVTNELAKAVVNLEARLDLVCEATDKSDIDDLREETKAVHNIVVKHKHASSGEAMIPIPGGPSE